MSANTQSDQWGVLSIASATGSLGLGVRGTVYVFRNFANTDKFLFLLADIGFGFSVGIRVHRAIGELISRLQSNVDFVNPNNYSRITANKAFSATNLHWASGAEATIGIAVAAAALSATSISAWPLFHEPSKPGATVNNDYFTGQVITGSKGLGLSASAAYQFMGRWIKLWSF